MARVMQKLLLALVVAATANEVEVGLVADDACSGDDTCAMNLLQHNKLKEATATGSEEALDAEADEADLRRALAKAVMADACGQGTSVSAQSRAECTRCGGELTYDKGAADGLGYAFCFCRVNGRRRQCASS
eukprot:gb/GFBE01060664.1/.p1 GENE.gb/GFBE01060664.1/~~gb/GFBE01060664.1/.p1  ORF type:complete len:132 (+),score=29.21 gb/GFBE01060664.1/:1-396(+)